MEGVAITEDQIRVALAMWNDGATEFEISVAIGCSVDAFRSLRLKQPSRWAARYSTDGGEVLTPKEVADRTEFVRSTWSDAERKNRAAHILPQEPAPYEVPVVAISDIKAAYRNR